MASRQRAIPRDEPLPDADVHSEGFRQTREALRSALVEDYVELIADLLPPGVLNIVNGFGLEAGKPLASNPRIKRSPAGRQKSIRA